MHHWHDATEFLSFFKQDNKYIKEERCRRTRWYYKLHLFFGNLGLRACREKGLHEDSKRSRKALHMSHFVDVIYLIMSPTTVMFMVILSYALLYMPAESEKIFFWRVIYDHFPDWYIAFAEMYAIGTAFANKYHTCIRKRAGYVLFVLWILLLGWATFVYASNPNANIKAFDTIFWCTIMSTLILITRSHLVKFIETLISLLVDDE